MAASDTRGERNAGDVRPPENRDFRATVTAEPFRSLSAVARKAVLNEVDRTTGPTGAHWVG
ncbi:hypothetical protein ACQPYE_32445 [Actinosynnema sp. CA-299493]